ncbi:MAG: hypothetical protein RXO22_09930 [Thermocladium sp.]
MGWRIGLALVLMIVMALTAYELLMGIVVTRALLMGGLMGVSIKGEGRHVSSMKDLLRGSKH